MNNNFETLDLITIISFFVGMYALMIGIQNLDENRDQNDSQEALLKYLEKHLGSQDEHLHKQDELIKSLSKEE